MKIKNRIDSVYAATQETPVVRAKLVKLNGFKVYISRLSHFTAANPRGCLYGYSDRTPHLCILYILYIHVYYTSSIPRFCAARGPPLRLLLVLFTPCKSSQHLPGHGSAVSRATVLDRFRQMAVSIKVQ